jgi:hypothetical protein
MSSILSENKLRIGELEPIADAGFASIWRWITKGLPAPDGQRVRLEAIRVGGKWVTSREAFERFCEALTPRFADSRPPPPTPSERSHASDRAEKKLEAFGI